MTLPAPGTLSPEAAAKLNQEAFILAYQEFQLRKPELESQLADDKHALSELQETSWQLREAYIRAIKEGLTANNAEIHTARESVARAVTELRQCSADTQAFRRTLTAVGRAASALVKLAAVAA